MEMRKITSAPRYPHLTFPSLKWRVHSTHPEYAACAGPMTTLVAPNTLALGKQMISLNRVPRDPQEEILSVKVKDCTVQKQKRDFLSGADTVMRGLVLEAQK